MDAPATPTNAQTFSFPDALGEERKVSEILSSDVTRAAEKALKTYPQGRYQNLIFVQPEALAGFRHRNLAVRVELRDLQIPASSSQDGGRALPAIFNTKQGPSLVTEQILPVTYHSREPRLNGQVKVALPLKLTSSVILYFTVFHVHVKDKNLRRGSTWRSGAFSSVFGGKDKGEQEPFRVTDVVAKGYLPIVQPRGCGELLHNGFHTIHMDLVNSDVDDDEEGQSEVSRKGRGEDNAPGHHLNLSSLDIPGLATSSSQLTLRVLVRTASSIHPSDPGLAALFANAPAALGCLNYPEHVLPRKNMDVPGEETDLALLAHQLSRERNTLSTTGKLHRALTLCLADTSPFQTCEFLLTTLRILLRILCAGSGQISTESWRDSNRFPKMRCQAFLLLPVLLERACCALDSIEKSGEGSDEAEKEKAEASMPDYLQAYVDLLFLEEVPQGQKECVVTPKSSRKTRSDEEIDAIAAVISEKVFDTVCEECLDELAVEGSTDAAARRARQVRCHTVTPAPISFEDVDALPSAGDVSKIYTSDEEPDFEGRKSEGLRRALKSLARSRSMEEENESQMWQLLGSVPAAEDEKWWPWVYEVIITQWHAVLNVVQNAKPPASVADTSVTAGSGSVSLMALEEVTEGDEDEEEDEEGDAPGDAENSVVYPFGADDMPEDFRKDLAKHAPFALKLILKSLALRLCYEGKDPPVLLDNSTAYNLGSLCAALGAEVMSLPLWQRQALNAAMADFFREFMTLVHPEQAGRALRAYLRVLKKHHSVEDFELRIVLLENLSMYDHFVVINSPQVHPGGVTIPSSRVRAIVTGLAFSDEASVRPRSLPSADDGVITSGSSEISAEVPNHWLAELVVNEVMSVVSLHTAEPHVREHAVAVLRQLFVGHTYDPRYQDDLSRRRIANMYLPLLGKTVDSVERLENYAPYSVTRRDLLACLVYLLQDAPANCMHAVYREMCSPGDSADASSTLQTAKAEAEAKQKTPTRPGWLSSVGGKSPPPPFTHGQLLSAAQVGTVLRREAGVGVLAHRMVQLLRLCLDTFEYPGDEGAGSNLVPGAVPSQDDGKIKGPKGKDALSALDSMMKAGRIAGSGTLSRAERRLQQKGRVRTGRRQFADRRKTGDTLRATRSAPSGHLSPMQTVCATKRQCHIAQAVIHRSFFALVDEAAPGIHCSPGVGENPVLQGSARTFLQEVHIYMLHALEVAQSDDVLVSLLYECKHLIFRFGASTFLESAENGVQDWCRRLLMLCNARVGKVRHSALSVLVYMINCCYLWQRLRRREGRAAVEYLLNPLMAVAPDCFAEMGGPAVGGIGRHAADDIFPHPVTDKASVEREYKAFRVSMEELKRWQSVQSSSAQAGGGGVNEALGQELVAIARTLLALLDAFLADKVILSDMEEAASKAEPASAFSGPLSYVSGPVAAANSALDASGQDLFFMQRTLLRAANCFSHENGPQLRVYYLQRLEALHTATGNRAEAALSALAAADTIDACRAAFERKELWAPHPPRRRIDGQTVAPGPLQIEKRNAGLECCVKARSLLPFGSMEKLDAEFSHYVERAADLLCQIPLPLHVIEAYERLTPRLAAKRDLAKLRDIHEKMTTAFKTADAEELVWRAGEFASYGFAEGGGMQNLGVYFRVLVFGAAPSTFLENAKTPASLIGDPRVVTNAHAEFVYRFPPLVQLVTATQAISNLLTAELRAILGDAELPSIEILPDRADEDELLKGAGSQKLYVKITLVRPVPEEVARAEGRTNLGGKAGEAVLEEVAEDAVQGIASGCKDSGMIISQQLAYPEFGERYDHFEFSVPFTASGKMQGSTSEQCKKLTYLSVNHAFPTLHTRVKVVRRRAILMSPIDCAVDDLSKRCVQMRMELAKPPTAVDKQALMRLVSGSVIPQVNGGAMEIAECFLSRVNMSNPIHLVNDEEMLQAKRRALASELLVFLTLCKELVNRTRHVLGITEQMIRQPPPDSPGDDGAREENTDITWQREVEKGLENMKAFMKPMVLQYNVEGADVFFSDARAKQHS
uniref:Uncharacterized protein n=1 Tax=Pinguiococcus pyrenoidosus TaxID=172671 RepID=A0A7R9U2A1_9STRA